MADFAVRAGLTYITDHLKTLLIKVIDQGRKSRTYGTVFSEPVDYISMNLPDYLEVVKRPMDFSTLRSNVMAGEYTYLHQFIKDADLIWTNCKVYNASQNDQYFVKAANECEQSFIAGICKIDELNITPEQYRLILQNPMPTLQLEEEGPMSMLQLHLLAKKLGDLPHDLQVQLVKWYYRQLGQQPPADLAEKDIKIVFRVQHARVTRELDKIVTRKLEDNRSMIRTTKV